MDCAGNSVHSRWMKRIAGLMSNTARWVLRSIALVLLFYSLSGFSSPGLIDEIFSSLGIRVSQGAAPGYVNDDACGLCHKEYYSYQKVAMARSFYPPSPDNVIEDMVNNHYYHEPSRRHYEMSIREGEYWFKRYQLDEEGKEINPFEVKVDWILGSGNHVRSYLYQTPQGNLFQLPIAWYSQEGKWGMQPGYEFEEHKGVSRVVQRECMFCHNAYPDVPEGSDTFLKPHVYPRELPSGTGCQRCHGPGVKHLRAIYGGDGDSEKIRASIVNPGRLPPDRRDDVCFECHMLPTVAATPVRRFDRPTYSFRPGQDLADYQINFDIEEKGKEPIDRFEINHHPYRLKQSQCYLKSEEQMSCLTCHDPHYKVSKDDRAAHYKAKCLGCHVDLQHNSVANDLSDDCVACHMPERRTQDVIEVTMTDHLIQIVPDGADFTSPIKKAVPNVDDILFLEPDRVPAGDLGEIYRVLGFIRPNAISKRNIIDYLAKLLKRSPTDSAVPYYDLIEGLLRGKRYREVFPVIEEVVKRDGVTTKSLASSAVANLGLGRVGVAIEQLDEALELNPDSPHTHYNLALAYYAQGKLEEADAHLKRAVEMSPNMTAAWYYLGKLAENREHHASAYEHYKQTLAIEPRHTRAYLGIVKVLDELGQHTEALRYLRHGTVNAGRSAEIEGVLSKRIESKQGK